MNEKNHRPWGNFVTLLDNEYCKVKIITVYPTQAPSYQSHEYRCEKYTIINGEGILTLDDEEIYCKKGDMLQIDFKQKHRIRCTSQENLVFIEVQLGTYFGEDDIVRYADDYNRA